jgi:hypothetical protein
LPPAGPTAHVAGQRRTPCPARTASETPFFSAVPGVFAPALQRSLVQSYANASLAASLAGVRVPVLLASASTRLALPVAQPFAPSCANGPH